MPLVNESQVMVEPPTTDKAGVRQLAEDAAGKYVSGLWTKHLSSTQQFRNRLITWYKQYRGIPSRKGYEGLANVFVNETLAAVESIVAQIYQTLRSDVKRFYAKPGEETDAETVELGEDLVNSSLENMDFDQKLLRNIRQAVKYGTTVAKIYRKFESKNIMKRERLEELGVVTSIVRENMVVTYDDAELEYLDLLDVAMDAGRATIDDMDWVIVRRRVTYDDLKEKQRQGVYGNLDKISKQRGASKSYDLVEKDRKLNSVGIYQQNFYDQNMYELYEFWGKVPIWWVDEDVDINSEEAAQMVEAVIEVVGESSPVVVRLERNPYWHQKKPFLLAHYIGVDDEAYGIGVCEILEYLQLELNDKRNQSLDAVTMKIFPPLEKLRSANIDNKDVQLLPRKIIPSDVANGLRPVNVVGEVTTASLMENTVKEDMRHESGATSSVQGVKQGGEQTAFEVSTLERRGASRINIGAIDFASKFLRPLYGRIYKMHQQYTTKEKVVARVGKKGIKWIKWTPESVITDFDFIPIVPTDIDNRAITIQQMIQFIGQIAKFYPQVNAYKIVRKIYTLFGFEDADEVVPEPDTEKGQNSLTFEQEILILEMGQKIDVKYWENHFEQLALLIPYLEQNRNRLNQRGVDAFEDKIMQHQRYLQNLQQSTGASPAASPAGPAGMGQIPSPVAPMGRVDMMENLQKQTVGMGG